jgi:hypothetical protein
MSIIKAKNDSSLNFGKSKEVDFALSQSKGLCVTLAFFFDMAEKENFKSHFAKCRQNAKNAER